MSRDTKMFALILLSVCILVGCKKKEDHAGHDHGSGDHAHAGASAACEHGLTEAKCPFCNPKLVKEMGMCGGHGVPEALCTQCNADLIPAFKAKKDWCAEHELPESQCTTCNPDLKNTEGKADTHGDGPKYPFEWGGVYPLPAGRIEVVLQPGPDDPSMEVTLLPVGEPTSDGIRSVAERAAEVFKQDPVKIVSGGSFSVGPKLYQMKLERTPMRFTLDVPEKGGYALFTEHFPSEFKTRFILSWGEEVTPVAITEFRISKVTLTKEAVKQSGIRVEPAGKQLLQETIIAPARVALNPEAMAHVGSPLTGRVVEFKARLGDTVKKDDVLLVIDSPQLGEAQLDLFQKRIAATIAEPAVALTRSAYERAKALYEQSEGIALTEVQKREVEFKTAEGNLAAAKATVSAAASRLQLLGMDAGAISELGSGQQIHPRSAIRAPISGQVVQREATLGELVGPEREALLVLADMTTLWVLADVPETKLAQVAVGASAVITLPSLGNKSFTGTVAYIAANLNPVTRTASVRIEVGGDQGGLRPGMFAQAEIAAIGTQSSQPVLTVPEQAVQTIQGQSVVFVPAQGDPQTFIKRVVKVGPTVGRFVPVLDGLKEGEPVVVSGSFILKADLGKAGAAHEH